MYMSNNIAIYLQRCNLQNATFERIEHKDASVAIVYKIIQPSGPNLILKICSHVNHYLRELYFLKHFQNILPTPNVISIVPPEQNLSGAILMEFLPGTLATDIAMSDSVIYEIGSMLAQIHQQATSGYGDLIIPNAQFFDPITYFQIDFQEGLEECKNHIPDELIDRSQIYFDKHIHLLRSVDGPCIIHRDFRAGNILVYQNKVSGIIDWSSSRASFAEEDFVSLEHLGWNFSNVQKQIFLSGYASIRPIPDYQRMMPLLRLSKALATLGFTIKTNTFKGHDAELYNFNRQWLQDFLQ
jgi:aminoglycoside phosphotransferase (APT) family kinase protein